MAPRRLVALVILAASLCGCPKPRSVSGVVRAQGAPVEAATVTWTCPEATSGPTPQMLTTDRTGAFRSKDFYVDMPGACEIVVTRAGYLERRERFDRLAGGGSPHVDIELRTTP